MMYSYYHSLDSINMVAIKWFNTNSLYLNADKTGVGNISINYQQYYVEIITLDDSQFIRDKSMSNFRVLYWHAPHTQ